MSNFNRKGFTTIKAKDSHGSVNNFSVRQGSKLERIAAHRNKQMEKQRKQHIRDYKAQLREAKRRIPLAERAKVSLQDL